MLQIQVNNEFLDITPGTQLPYVINNPLFADDISDGDYSFTITIPASPKNNRILGFPSIGASSNFTQPNFLVNLYFQAIEPFRLNMYVQIARNGDYDCYFVSRTGDIKALLDTSIKDLNWENIITISPANRLLYPFIVLQFDLDPNQIGSLIGFQVTDENGVVTDMSVDISTNDIKLVCEIICENINFGSGAYYAFVINDSKNPGDTKASGNQVIIYKRTSSLDTTRTITPKWLTNASFTFELLQGGNFPDPLTIKDHMNDVYLNPDNYQHCFFPLYNPSAFPDDAYRQDATDPLNIVPIKKEINAFSTNDNSFVVDNNLNQPKDYDVIPFVYIKTIISQIQSVTGFQIISDFLLSGDFQKLIINNNHSIDVPTTESPGIITFNNYINYSDHLPETTIKDLFVALRKLVNCTFFFDSDSKVIRILSNENIIKNAIAKNFTSNQQKENQFSIINTKTYTLSYKISSNDSFSSNFSNTLFDPTTDNTVVIGPDDQTHGGQYEVIAIIGYINITNAYNASFTEGFYKSYDTNDPDGIYPSGVEIDRAYVDNLFPFSQASISDVIIESDFSPLQLRYMESLEDVSDTKYLFPAVSEKIYSSYFKQLAESDDLRLLFYWGNQQGYPLASPHYYDSHGNKIGTQTLIYNIPSDSLYHNMWQQWIRFIATQKSNDKFLYLSNSEIQNIKLWEKICIDNCHYLIQSITVNFPVTDVAECILIQVL